MNKLATIYQLHNMITGYSYIGVTTDIAERMKSHKSDLVAETWTRPLMQEHFLLHGPQSFELVLLDYCPIDIMFELEAVYIKHFSATSFVYNIAHANKSDGYSKLIDNKAIVPKRRTLPFI